MSGLASMIAAGGRALARRPGLLAVLFGLQLLVAGAAGLVTASALAQAFAHHPLWDAAVDGDLAALVSVVTDHPALFITLACVGVAAALLYGALTWFTTGGVIAVLAGDPAPRGRRATAAAFGSGGATTFLAYVRLALWSLIPWAVVAGAALYGLVGAATRAETALTTTELVVALARGLAPAFLLATVLQAATGYARVDLSRHAGLSAWRALLRGFRFVVRRPAALLHQLGYYLIFAAASAGYVAFTRGRAWSGADGALILFLIRQVTVLVRLAAGVALIAGQLALAAARQPPPRGWD